MELHIAMTKVALFSVVWHRSRVNIMILGPKRAPDPTDWYTRKKCRKQDRSRLTDSTSSTSKNNDSHFFSTGRDSETSATFGDLPGLDSGRQPGEWEGEGAVGAAAQFIDLNREDCGGSAF
jgi:hypothetical protein